MHGLQGPASMCNLVCSEIQADFIVGTIDYMEQNKFNKIEANADDEIEYKRLINTITNMTLFPYADRLIMVLHLRGNSMLTTLSPIWQLVHARKHSGQGS
jgi:hypothetical protein